MFSHFLLQCIGKGGKATREMMHSGQGANLKSLFFPVCCHLSWLNKTRRRKREIGFSVNVNILIKANTKHSELLTKKKLNWIMKGMQMEPFLCMITRTYAFCIFFLCWSNLCCRTRCSRTGKGRWTTHFPADDSRNLPKYWLRNSPVLSKHWERLESWQYGLVLLKNLLSF